MGLGTPSKICCICKHKQSSKKASQKEIKAAWRQSVSYEVDFVGCFGDGAKGRSGDICTLCRTRIQTYRKSEKRKTFNNILDAKEVKVKLTCTPESNNIEKPLKELQNIQMTNTNSDELHYKASSGCDLIQSKSPRSRKRLRDDSPDTNRISRTCFRDRPPTPSVHLDNVLVKFVYFLGYNLPGKVVGHIMQYLNKDDIINLTLNFILPQTQEISMCEKKKLKTKSENVNNVSEFGPLTQPQKEILSKLVKNRENNQDNDGCIIIPHVGSGGKPRRYLKVPKIQISSGSAQKRTKNVRSQFIEKVEQIISTPIHVNNMPASKQDNIHSQRVNNIARDKDGYSAAAEEAGLKVITKFSRQTVLSLRSVMTLRLWRTLKRVFAKEAGRDLFGSVDLLQEDLRHIEFEYECGVLTSSNGDKIHFVRVSDIKQVIMQLVNDLRKAGELVYLDTIDKECLWLHVATDKGGKSSKLILQVINQKSRHSMDFAKLIGYFEGPDNRYNLESIFGPVLSQVQECIKDITRLKLVRPLPDEDQTAICKDHTTCDDSIRWTPCQPFDPLNTAVSAACKHCKQCRCARSDINSVDEPPMPPPIDFTPRPLPYNQMNSSNTTPSVLDQSVDEGNEIQTDSSVTNASQPHHNQSLVETSSMPAPTLQIDLTSPDVRTPSAEIRTIARQFSVSDRSEEITLVGESEETPQRKPSDRLKPRQLLPQMNSTKALEETAKKDESHIYTSSVLTVGGDWEGLSKIIGLAGPNGKYFCNHCLVKLDDLQKGIPHGTHILPKYKSEIQVKTDYPLRTFKGCKEMYSQYQDAGDKAKSMHYQSCQNQPLLDGDLIIDSVSTTPLHISLGLGLQALNLIEKEAIQLDNQIKKAGGHYDAFTSVYDRKEEILVSCKEVNEHIEEIQDKIDLVIEKKKEIIKDRASFFNKNHASYKSDVAKGVRDSFAKLGTEKTALENEKEKLVKTLKKKEGTLEKVNKELESIKGPFKERLDDLLDNLKLKRAAYHSGALIGPDVKKLVTKSNISKFGDVFKPMEIRVCSDKSRMAFQALNIFSTDELRVKIITLLTKLRLCYELYTANRILCRHEVELLALRCSSYGNWFPVNFPEENLKRKFHLLTCDVPIQARRLKSTGIITEQTIESIHPYINELDRRFAKVSDKTKKGLIICKQQNMYSQATWNAVKRCGNIKRNESGV